MSDIDVHIYEYPMDDGYVYRVRPYLDMYEDNDNLHVGLEFYRKEDGFWEPDLSITVNTIPLAYCEGTIDINNNGTKILDFLESNGFGQRTPWVVRSGHCVYPIFRFYEEKLNEIDEKVFQEYAKTFGKDKSSLNTLISDAQQKDKAFIGHQPREQER